ncbi:hypothetical protein J3458_004107 [Metarhizium acridum]|uniref:uncharacterized protein n=1 Tax=Metarhizium acridum TaxID=92637 RepID=UPI001C6BCFCE|nr:hypothetical protein J3458_004107 [Metarhizium acridum]
MIQLQQKEKKTDKHDRMPVVGVNPRPDYLDGWQEPTLEHCVYNPRTVEQTAVTKLQASTSTWRPTLVDRVSAQEVERRTYNVSWNQSYCFIRHMLSGEQVSDPNGRESIRAVGHQGI